MKYYPVALNLKSKKALVVGGGKVAERKVNALLEAGSNAAVISPDLTPGLKQLFMSGKITWRKKNFHVSDSIPADIIIAATSNMRINRKVRQWAGKHKILVNVVDNACLSDFISPAVLRGKKAIIAVYTDGKDPVLSRDLKNFLKENWGVFLSYRRGLQKRSS